MLTNNISMVLRRCTVSWIFLCGISFADQYNPVCGFRKSSENQRFYLVIQVEQLKADSYEKYSYWYVKRQNQTATVTDENDSVNRDGRRVANARVAVRSGDRVICKGQLNFFPLVTLVSGQGNGFALLGNAYSDFSGAELYGNGVTYINEHGKTVMEKRIDDLFSGTLHRGEVGSFDRGTNTLYWLHSGWIDETTNDVVVVSAKPAKSSDSRATTMRSGSRLIRSVNLKTKKVEERTDAIEIAILRRNIDGVAAGLNLLIEAGRIDYKLRQPLIELFNGFYPLKIRLRAAVALTSFGDQRGASLFKQVASTDQDVAWTDRIYAIEYLPEMFGSSAATLICDSLRQHSDRVLSAVNAIHKLDPATSMRAFASLVNEPSPNVVNFALYELASSEGARLVESKVIEILTGKNKKRDYTVQTKRFAAEVISHAGKQKKATIEVLVKLAKEHSTEEWNRFEESTEDPSLVVKSDKGLRYSHDEFVNAVWADSAVNQIHERRALDWVANLIPLPRKWNNVISNGGRGFNATQI